MCAATADFCMTQITPAFLAAHDRPGPRYTSYPTAVEFHTGFGASDHQASLQRMRDTDSALSLYVHIPFCAQRCAFCGCNVIVANRDDIVARYLQSLTREIDMVADALGERRNVVQLHFGGGTPTHLTPVQMTGLIAHLDARFHVDRSGELAIEVDPDITTDAQLDCLRELGFNRLSVGVQDFNPAVLAAAGRPQRKEDVVRIVEKARQLGFSSVNFDLVYGLPLQTPASFSKTIAETIALLPDRIAVYGFAWLPRLKKNQRHIDETLLPSRDTRFALYAAAITGLTAAGYQQVGMDHFARRTDELARASSAGTLYRNFMGYTVHRTADMIGVGLSAISHCGGAFAQNHKLIGRYHRAIKENRLPVERGVRLAFDDTVRQAVITELMCNFAVHIQMIETRFHIDFAAYFAPELAAIAAADRASAHPLLEMSATQLTATDVGRLFIRNVCMFFDAYLRRRSENRPAFSRTV
jgi:oxygen-independent coproporphyrinogen-3 oxidase